MPSNLPTSRGNQQDSPLASQLPAWDLVPAHTLLVRRRPGALNRPASRSDAPDKAPIAVPPPPVPVAVAPAPVNAPPPAMPDRFCQHCGSQLEDGATFCTDCGTKL
ncbi:MAG: zinc ribbon domain-containing protein [Acidobacteria bacterium]|nr:zinc ribbon domain-containing protein [Acidobacteriota bacterium]